MKYNEDVFTESFQAVAQNIKKLRIKYALTQKQMSEKLDIDAQYYSRLERGNEPNRNFTLEKVLLACSLFNVEPNDLITKIPDINKTNYDVSGLKKDISKKMNNMSAEQLNGLREYMKNMPKES